MSRSEIRRKHVADATQLRRRSHPASPTYKEGPPGRTNGRSCIMHTRKDTRAHLSACQRRIRMRVSRGVGRTPGSAEPALPPIQVHFEESWPRHLITFHTCVGGKPTSTSINRPLLHPPQHTHTHTSFHHSKKALLPLALLAR